MRNDASESRTRAEVSAAHARHKVNEQALCIASMTSTDPRLEGARKLLRQMEQSLASAELSLVICGYDDDAFTEMMKRSG